MLQNISALIFHRTALPHGDLPPQRPQGRFSRLLLACRRGLARLTVCRPATTQASRSGATLHVSLRPAALTSREKRQLLRHQLDVWQVNPLRLHGKTARAYCNENFLPQLIYDIRYSVKERGDKTFAVFVQLPESTRASLKLESNLEYSIGDIHYNLAVSIVKNDDWMVKKWAQMADLLPASELPSLQHLLCLSEHDQKIVNLLAGDNQAAQAYRALRKQLQQALEHHGQQSLIGVPDYETAMLTLEEQVANELLRNPRNLIAPLSNMTQWMRLLTDGALEELPCNWDRMLFSHDAQGHCRLEQALRRGEMRSVKPLLTFLSQLPYVVKSKLSPPASLIALLQQRQHQIESGEALLKVLQGISGCGLPGYADAVVNP
jgi:hypothetical protein